MNKGAPLKQSDYLHLALLGDERLHCDRCPSIITGDPDISMPPSYIGVQKEQIIHVLCHYCWEKISLQGKESQDEPAKRT